MFPEKVRRIHFVGIGGAGMSGIAQVLLTLGCEVTGSDLQASPTTRRLEKLGARVMIGHAAEHVASGQVVVVSSAVASDNIEILTARARGIPVIPRAEMLAELMRLKRGIAVAGAHGKTTTTSMVASVLSRAGLDPTAVIGGTVRGYGGNAKLGQGDILVAEADESDGTFLRLTPTIAVVTTIDREHLDHYGDFVKLKAAFTEFVNRVPFYGLAVLCADEPAIREILPRVDRRVFTYGLESPADLGATGVRVKAGTTTFEAVRGGASLGPFTLQVPGRHYAANALAAIAVGLELNVPVNVIRTGLQEFGGVERRFQVKGERRQILVVDDYGHHPTEVRVTLRAAKEGWGRRLVVVFQPHRYTRTRDLLDEFATAFEDADAVVLTEIYPAGERPIPGVTGRLLSTRIAARRPVEFIEDKAKIVDRLLASLKPGDLVLTLGAGDVWKIGEALLQRL